MRTFTSAVLAGLIGFLISGCQTDVVATSHHEVLRPAALASSAVVAINISVGLPHGYSSDDLRVFSHWTEVGSIPEGKVYQRAERPYLVRVNNNYECYLVVKDNTLLGIYIPSYSAFVECDPPAIGVFKP